ncbi:hypothetical protein BC834DRAFT_846023 [Gloeopeniophorella convolvens]|nr:hypothetical protein BC834DRAFT_846023 [Gloeopeniophorella convolvens]
MGAENSAYMDLFSKYLESAASLKVIQSAHDKLIEKVGTTSTQVGADALPAPPMVTLNKGDYQSVKYWRKADELTGRKPRNQNEFPTPENTPRGPGQSAEGENVAFWFVEDRNGNMVSSDTVKEFRKFAKDIWMRWVRAGYMQSPWSTVENKYKNQYYALMEDEFPFLRLCARHYKCDTIAHTDYSHWYKSNVLGKLDGQGQLASQTKSERAQSLVPAKRTRSPSPVGDTKASNAQENPLEPRSDAVADKSESQTPTPDPACPPAIARVRPRIVIDQTTSSVPATLPQEPTRHEQTKTATQPDLVAIVARRAPPPSVLQPGDLVSAPVPSGLASKHRETQMAPPASSTPGSSEAIMPGATQKGKGNSRGSSLMRPNKNSKTPRNLYAIWYIKTHGPQTCDKFAKAWDEIDSATLEEWKQISADAKKFDEATT